MEEALRGVGLGVKVFGGDDGLGVVFVVAVAAWLLLLVDARIVPIELSRSSL